MPSLYQNQETNLRRTWILFTAFFLVVIGLGWVFAQVFQNDSIIFIAAGFSIISSIASYWYSDKIALAFARAAPIAEKDNPRLYHTIENLCITAGLPMPRIYLTPEKQINAFATGRNKEHAVIAVTAGALAQLDKT